MLSNLRIGITVLLCAFFVLMPLPPSANAADDISIDVRKDAVSSTIKSAKECKKILSFYWEIGDANGLLASGKKGKSFDADTSVNLASGSKWLFATYLLEKYGSLTDSQIQMLTQRSGYRSFLDQACGFTWNVNDCMNLQKLIYGTNDLYTSENPDTFFYSGAHFQQLAIEIGLGKYTSSKLATEIKTYLNDGDMSFLIPAVGSGMRASAKTFSSVMRKMMTNEYKIGELLGSDRTCTLESLCPTSLRSPLKTDWDYSLGHWVEHETGGPDEAFSGPGLQGFYPWISADKTLYGVLSTEVIADLNARSSACGGKMRKAWISGVMVQ